MFRSLCVVMLWLAALALSACQVQGLPQEAPASYPDSAAPAAPEQLDPAPETLDSAPDRLDAERAEAAPSPAPTRALPAAPAANEEEAARARTGANDLGGDAEPSVRGSGNSPDKGTNNTPIWDDSSSSNYPAPAAAKRFSGNDAISRDREREVRPGLATHWGETRESPSEKVDFVRASPSHPAHFGQIHYNDRTGALAMLPDGNWSTSEVSTRHGALALSMVDESGRPFQALRRGDRVIALGDPGERYALRIENHSSERFEVVATVDGLDVLDGGVGSVQKRGYLVAAHGSVIIDGFRRSQNDVAAFRLGDVARSYANSKGKARNVGVIGFALFEEQKPVAGYATPPQPRGYPRDTRLRQSADAFPGSYAQPPVW